MPLALSLINVFVSLVFYILVNQVEEASTCSCTYGSWQAWGDCSSICFGRRQRKRDYAGSVWCFSSCSSTDWQTSVCNKYCQNGGRLFPWSSSCSCRKGFTGRCCTSWTTDVTARPDKAESSGGNAGIYVGAVFAAIALLIAISVGAFVIYKKNWANQNTRVRPYSSRCRNHNTISMIEYNGSDDANNYTSHGYRNGYRKY